MSERSRSSRWLWALVIILVILFIYRLTLVPETEEVPEQVEEIEWEEVDKIVYAGEEEVQLVRDRDNFVILTNDTTYTISDRKILGLYLAFNKFQRGDLKPVDFEQWIRNKPDTTYKFLKLYKNTEQVLDLYITPGDSRTYFRYPDSKEIYQASTIDSQQLMWLDSLAGK